jgi:hypothetical protein
VRLEGHFWAGAHKCHCLIGTHMGSIYRAYNT